jgi:ketosteroid isomerase-like protein
MRTQQGGNARSAMMDQPIVAQFIDRLASAFEEDDAGAAVKAAESTNVWRVQESYRAIARGDFAGFLDMLTEDVEMEFVGSPRVPFAGRWRGRDEAARAVQENFAQVEEQRPEILSVVAQGDLVVIVARERGRFRKSGRAYETHWVQIFTIREGKIARFRQICDSSTMIDT